MIHLWSELAQWLSILSTVGGLFWFGGTKARQLEEASGALIAIKGQLAALRERERALSEALAVQTERTALLKALWLGQSAASETGPQAGAASARPLSTPDEPI